MIEDKCWFSPIVDSGLILTPCYGDNDTTGYHVELQEGNTDSRPFEDIIKNSSSLQYKLIQRRKILHEKRMLEYKNRNNTHTTVKLSSLAKVIEPIGIKKIFTIKN